MQQYWGLSREAIGELSDEVFVDLAAGALWLHRSQEENVRNGVMEAVSKLFGGGKR